jgi:hypothetical protein
MAWEAIPRSAFTYVIPEAIGPTDGQVWGAAPPMLMTPDWTQDDQGGFGYTWEREGLLRFSPRAAAFDDHVDVHISLTNLSDRAWPESSAFSCFSPRGTLPLGDFDGSRTFLLADGEWTPITRVERVFGPRPTIQLWYVSGGPRDLPCVDMFKATPALQPEGVLAVRSYDERHIVAVTADRPLYLFANLEFCCIHCCPSFGALAPGETGEATHRVFFCEGIALDELTPKLMATWARA